MYHRLYDVLNQVAQVSVLSPEQKASVGTARWGSLDGARGLRWVWMSGRVE